MKLFDSGQDIAGKEENTVTQIFSFSHKITPSTKSASDNLKNINMNDGSKIVWSRVKILRENDKLHKTWAFYSLQCLQNVVWFYYKKNTSTSVNKLFATCYFKSDMIKMYSEYHCLIELFPKPQKSDIL